MRAISATVLILGTFGTPAHPNEWSSRPASERPAIVGLRVGVDGKTPARVRIPAGQRATIGIPSKGTLGLTPFVVESAIELEVVETLEASGEGTSAIVARLQLRLGETAVVDASFMHLEIEWIELIPSPGKGLTQQPAGPCTVCCVYRDSQWLCACEVRTPCGNCCCPTACACSSTSFSIDSSQPPSIQRCSPTGAAAGRIP